MSISAYNKYSKEQLAQMLVSRDEEVSSLRVMNREVHSRLREVEAQLHTLLDRLQTVENHSSSLTKKLSLVEGSSHAAQATLEDLVAQRNQIAAKTDDLEKVLENEVVWRRGFFPYLGLAVEKDERFSDGLLIKQVNKPASSHGIEEGDVLLHASATYHKRILNVQDYATFVTDLPPQAAVTLELQHRNGGGRGVVQLTPLVGSYRSS